MGGNMRILISVIHQNFPLTIKSTQIYPNKNDCFKLKKSKQTKTHFLSNDDKVMRSVDKRHKNLLLSSMFIQTKVENVLLCLAHHHGIFQPESQKLPLQLSSLGMHVHLHIKGVCSIYRCNVVTSCYGEHGHAFVGSLTLSFSILSINFHSLHYVHTFCCANVIKYKDPVLKAINWIQLSNIKPIRSENRTTYNAVRRECIQGRLSQKGEKIRNKLFFN